MPFRNPPARTKGTTTQTGTLTTFTVAEPVVAGWRTFTKAVTDGDLANGDTVPLIIVDTTVTTGVNLFQLCTATWNNTTKQFTVVQNAQPAVPPSWGAGTRDVVIVDNPMLYLLLAGGTLTGLMNILISGGLITPATETSLVVQRSGTAATDVGISLVSGTTGKSRVNLGDSADEKAIGVIGDNNLNALIFRTNGADGPRVNSAGVLTDAAGTAYLTSAAAASVPSGAVTDWYMTAAPTSWTRVTTINDKTMIIVSAGSPGTVSASVWDVSGLSADGVSLTVAQMPSHGHTIANVIQGMGTAIGILSDGLTAGGTTTTNTTGGGDSHGHVVSSTGTWRPPAAYMLLASKN